MRNQWGTCLLGLAQRHFWVAHCVEVNTRVPGCGCSLPAMYFLMCPTVVMSGSHRYFFFSDWKPEVKELFNFVLCWGHKMPPLLAKKVQRTYMIARKAWWRPGRVNTWTNEGRTELRHWTRVKQQQFRVVSYSLQRYVKMAYCHSQHTTTHSWASSSSNLLLATMARRTSKSLATVWAL